MSMPPEHVGILMNGTAMVMALVVGATASTYGNAVKSALMVWFLLLAGLLIGGPPSPYFDFSSDVVVAISRGIAICLAALLAHAVSGLFRRRPRQP
jgi:hypothetical protein